ncbi:sugar MFS transporter [Chitinophaga sp. MM2321]|uniref:sugar MFS transporter n=1 Tax=Chitinophaga sp. MM2321 TaxID=3137178 RepID=UPI0032D5AF9B
MLQKKFLPPMMIIGFLFFVFGFVSWLNAILIPYFKLSLQLSLSEAMMVAFAFYISYFIMALPSSWILERTGLKKGMMLGLFVMALGALLFIPAAHFRNYPMFLVGLFVQATGLTLLQTAANPYVTILGPIESAASRMSLMGVCNKVAGAVAPLILLKMVTKSPQEIDDIKSALPGLLPQQATDVLQQLILRLQTPYGVMAAVLILLGLIIYFSGLPDIKQAQKSNIEKESIFRFPHLMLGTFAIFCGVSVEVLAVDSVISYAEFHGFSFLHARYFATYTLVVMITGYLFGIAAIPRYISQRNTLIGCAGLGMILTLVILVTPGSFSVWSVVMLGLCNALIWPAIWPLALKGLGAYTERGAAFLIMGIVGGAITPTLFGAIAVKSNLQQAYVILLPLYFFLLYYGYTGCRKGKRIKVAQVVLQEQS